ncbi:MAG: glycoside hydrolase family 2 protein [Pseudomonadota bacterium]
MARPTLLVSTSSTPMLLSSLNWRLYKAEPDEYERPALLAATEPLLKIDGAALVVPALRSADIDYDDADEFDWWYQCEFSADLDHPISILRLHGLATLAEVWLNDELILSSENMFVNHAVNVGQHLQEHNVLSIAFRSVSHALKARRPRPKWKTNLVDHQRLRWFRTTLLGRIPGWTPKARAIGPWRPIDFVQGETALHSCRVLASLDGSDGVVTVDTNLQSSVPIQSASITVGKKTIALDVDASGNDIKFSGTLKLPVVEQWFPHTHGLPVLHDYRVSVTTRDNDEQVLKSGRLGFRSIDWEQTESNVGFSVNGQDVFCRGACWTTADIYSLGADRDKLRQILSIAADIGANMIRVGGTMTYESDDFYELCDELGILVWQDFMFANMDYPIDDEAFRDNVTKECQQQIRRLSQHACLAIFCGNSEVEQQAAMFGRTAEDYQSNLFYELIPALIATDAADCAYVAASPTGGALPFHNRNGVSHYFGVGAYRRPIADAATAGILFTSECLGFSNLPSKPFLRQHFGSEQPDTLSLEWKAGVPRDAATDWDFQDVSDHYLVDFFGRDAINYRFADNATYVARATTVAGEVMRRTFPLWREPSSACSGGIVWNMMDIVPGAGWGFVATDGSRKPTSYYLRRAWHAQTVSLLDRGLDGLAAQVINDAHTAMNGVLHVAVLRNSKIPLATAEIEIALDPASQRSYSIDEAIGYFLDTTYAYRFGALAHNVVVATYVDNYGEIQTDAFFPKDRTLAPAADAQVDVLVTRSNGEVEVSITSDTFLQDLVLDADGFEFSDNYFHLAPNTKKTVRATRISGNTDPLRGMLTALNLPAGIDFQ